MINMTAIEEDLILLKKHLLQFKKASVLDIGAGDGFFALYCASFGANVDVVDIKKFPPYLNKHPKLSLIKKSLGRFKISPHKRYDLIIVRSVLHFLEPKVVFGHLLPQLKKSLRRGGSIYIATMTPPENSGRFLYTPKELTKELFPLKLISKKTRKSMFKIKNKSYAHTFWRLVYRK